MEFPFKYWNDKLKPETPVKTLDRLVQILDAFALGEPAWTLAGLAEKLDIPKSSLHRFLGALEHHGILERDPLTRSYVLGYRLWRWGNQVSLEANLRQLARPILATVAEETGETAILTVCRQREAVCLDKVESDQPVRMTIEVGRVRPLHAGASSKVLMAYLPASEIEAIVREKGLPKLCTNTITDPDRLRAELARIRELGYAESREETDASAYGLAVPVFTAGGEVLAGLGIAGPAMRLDAGLRDKQLDVVRRAAERLSAALGYVGPGIGQH